MRFSLLLSFILFSTIVSSQNEFEITKIYKFKDGLSNELVTRVKQDSQGFLWIGTFEGLNRFDGQEFEQYFHERKNPNSLPHDVIWDILEYQPGMLLIATSNGIGVFNTFTKQFENDKIQFSQLKSGSGTNVTKFQQFPDGTIWVNHSGEFDVLDQNLDYLYRFTDLEWTKSIKGVSMYLQDWVIDQHERIWVPSDTFGIIIIDLKAKSILSYKNCPKNLHYFSHRLIRSLLLEGDSILWVSQWGEGLIKYNIHTGEKLLSLLSENENSIPEMIKTEDGYMLLGGFGDVYEFNPNTLSYFSIPEYGLKSYPNKKEIISSISFCKTKNETYWLGAAEGLYKINRKIPRKEINIGQAWAPNTKWIFSKNENIYVLGGEKWLVEIDQKRNALKQYAIPASLSINFPSSIGEDHKGFIWIGSEIGIRRFDPITKTFDIPSFLPDLVKGGKIRVIYCDRAGYLWVGMADPLRLFRISPENKDFESVPESILLPFSSTGPMGTIQEITEDENGNLWMSSNISGGILFHEKATNQWINYPKSDQNKVFLAENGIKTIWPDTKGNIWLIRVVGDGLVRYNYKTDSISIFTREDGLLSNLTSSFANDNEGNLWICSPSGTTRFSLTNNQISGHFSIDNSSNAVDYMVSFDSFSNKLLLGGVGKMIWLDPNKLIDTLPPPRPFLDGVSVNNKIIQINTSSPILNLDYRQKNISIAFNAINFSNTEKIQFAYSLTGEDDDWAYSTTSRVAQYTFLSPGKYGFKVKVSDGSGVWSENYNLLTFTIHPPFWQTAWFRITIGLILIISTYILVRRRITTIKHEADLNQKIAETEMMALRAQMNPHFIFNCINSIDALIQSNDKYHATLYLNKFAKLIRNILDSSKINDMTIAKDLETLKLYIELEQFRHENTFTAEIIADPAVLQGDYKVPPLIVQPYVENAIIHGLRNRTDNEGKVTISISKEDGYIRYMIEDNGVGRKATMPGKPAEKKSYGMEMSSERIKLFNKEEFASLKITDLENNGLPSGTRVEVLLKMI